MYIAEGECVHHRNDLEKISTTEHKELERTWKNLKDGIHNPYGLMVYIAEGAPYPHRGIRLDPLSPVIRAYSECKVISMKRSRH